MRHVLALAIALLAPMVMTSAEDSDVPKKDCFVASYYFPNYHVDARNEARLGKGWSEWELVKQAKPRFPGHVQPNVPAWGYTDEADPAQMAQKIDAAADHGIDAFIFDWYYYNDGPFLERGVEQGFMKAKNNARMKFGLMWANHDWSDIFPCTTAKTPEILYPAAVTNETFDRVADLLIAKYFSHPSYWKIDGRPYFSIYELHTLMKGLGGLDATAAALQRLRDKAHKAGLPGVHLNAVIFGVQLLPGETALQRPEQLIEKLGFDSVTSYVWVHHVAMPEFPQTPYAYVMDKYLEYCNTAAKKFPVPYHPNVSMGWDPSPRCKQSDAFVNHGYPFTPTLSGNTPEAFEIGLRKVKALLDNVPAKDRILTINCWNEWTEGSYLEPDTRHGMAYLEAVKRVFGK